MEIHDELEAILELLGDITRNTASLCLKGLRIVRFPYPFVHRTFLWYLCLLSLVQEDSPLSHCQNPPRFALRPLAPRL